MSNIFDALQRAESESSDGNSLTLTLATELLQAAEQKLCDLVTIVNGQNDSVTIAIDQLTHLPVQKTFTYRDKDKYKVEESEVFANYREQQGIMTPFTWTRKKDGLMASQRFITNIDYNVPIEDAKFDAKVSYDPHELQKEKKK